MHSWCMPVDPYCLKAIASGVYLRQSYTCISAASFVRVWGKADQCRNEVNTQLFDKLDFVVLVTKCNKDDKCNVIVLGAVMSEDVYLKSILWKQERRYSYLL